jgi:hypothetical protein
MRVATKLVMHMGHDVDRFPLFKSTARWCMLTWPSASCMADITAAYVGLTIAPVASPHR